MRPALGSLIVAVLAAGPARAQTPVTVPAQASPPPLRISTPTPQTLGTSPFLGGVPSGTATTEPIKLTVISAILRALDHNLGVLTAEEALGRAQGVRWTALNQVLPSVNGRIGESSQKINLAAFGFGSTTQGPFAGIPSIVGPFNVFDARLSVTQNLFNLEAMHDARSEGHALEAARFSRQSARDFVVHVAGNIYIQALAASARADAARAQFETADALFKQATDLKQGGIIAGIDVLRAQVQLSAQQQRLSAAVNDFEKVKLTLARVIGLPLGQAIELDPRLPVLPAPLSSVEDAVERAYASRPDIQAALERVKAAESARASAAGARLPSVHLAADVGEIGLTPRDARTTYTVLGALDVPIFSGRTKGRVLEADADLRLRKAELEDLKASIYYEVRVAFLDLEATASQLRVATTARELAAQQLTQARDRFAAGVASNVEVIQAQEAVALASEQFITAQYGFDLARGALVRGIGSSEQVLKQLIGGTR